MHKPTVIIYVEEIIQIKNYYEVIRMLRVTKTLYPDIQQF